MHLVFFTPFPEAPGGGSAFNAGLIPALRDRGYEVTVEHNLNAPLPTDALPVVDGMILPSLEPLFAGLLRQDTVVVVHHVLAAAGRSAEARAHVHAAEARMLPQVRRVVTTSAEVAARLQAEFGVVSPAIVQPGMPELPRNLAGPNPCRILSTGVLTPRKGHGGLLHALARLTDLDWTLAIAGDTERDRVLARDVAALIDDLGLAHRAAILPNPEPDALEAAWRSAGLFASASRWEGWPAGIAEAMRRGIPVVALDAPGVGGFVPACAGIACAPGDEATWGKCLRRAIYDTGLRAALADGAWAAGCTLPGWAEQAAAFDAILRS